MCGFVKERKGLMRGSRQEGSNRGNHHNNSNSSSNSNPRLLLQGVGRLVVELGETMSESSTSHPSK